MRTPRSLFILLGICVIAITASIIYLAHTEHEEILREAAITSRNYAGVIDARLDATFRRVEAHVQELAREVPPEALSRNNANVLAPKLNGGLDVRKSSVPEIVGLHIWDAQGDLLYTSDSITTQRINVADRDYFIAAKNMKGTQVTLSEVTVSHITGRTALFMACSVRDENGILMGVISASVEIEYFDKLLQSLVVGRQGSVGVYRTDNFKPVAQWPAPETDIDALLSPDNPIRRLVAAGNQSGSITFASTLDNVTRLSSFKVLTNYPIYVSVGIARDDALNAWQARWMPIGIGCLLWVALLTLTMRSLWKAEKNLTQLHANIEEHVAHRTVELVIANADAEAARLTKRKHLSSTSQKIPPPVNGRMGMSHLLHNTSFSNHPKNFVRAIFTSRFTSGRTLQNLLRDALDLARIETQGIKLEETNFDLVLLMTEIGNAYLELATSRNSTLNMSVDPAIPRRLIGDPGRLRQLLSYLANHALKYAEDNVLGMEASVALRQPGHNRLWLHFAVTKTAKATSKKVAGHMRQPIAPITATSHATPSGVGASALGLSIGKRLVEILGGSIRTQMSKSDDYEQVTFELPFEIPQEAKATGNAKASVTDLTKKFSVRARGAEANEINQEVFRPMVKRPGNVVTIAGN